MAGSVHSVGLTSWYSRHSSEPAKGKDYSDLSVECVSKYLPPRVPEALEPLLGGGILKVL